MTKIKWGYIALSIFLIVLILWIIQRQIKEHMEQDDPMLYHLRKVLEPVHPAMKTIKLYKSDKSYTINKEKIFLCLRDKNGDYYPLNMLVYVTLHELAHALNTKDVGHTEEFHRIFDELLLEASKQGAFNHSIPIIQEYSNH